MGSQRVGAGAAAAQHCLFGLGRVAEGALLADVVFVDISVFRSVLISARLF